METVELDEKRVRAAMDAAGAGSYADLCTRWKELHGPPPPSRNWVSQRALSVDKSVRRDMALKLAEVLGVTLADLVPSSDYVLLSSDDFHGRARHLEEIRTKLERNHVLLHGLTQIGKTYLCRKLAERLHVDGRPTFILEPYREGHSFGRLHDELAEFVSMRLQRDVARRDRDLGGDEEARMDDLVRVLRGTRAVVVVEDCQYIEDETLRRFVSEKLIPQAQGYRVVLVTQDPGCLQLSEAALHKLRPHELGGWDRSEVAEYFEGHELAGHQLDAILEATAGHPGLCWCVRTELDGASGPDEIESILDSRPVGDVTQLLVEKWNEWLFDKLEKRERRLVLALSVFKRGASREALEHVLGEGVSEEDLTGRRLRGFVRHDRRDKYSLHDCVVHVALSQVSDSEPKFHHHAAEYHESQVMDIDLGHRPEYPGLVESMFCKYLDAGTRGRAQQSLRRVFVMWMTELNRARHLTSRERVDDGVEDGRRPGMNRVLHICFDIVESFADEQRGTVLEVLIQMIWDAKLDTLVRAQPMYFILVSRLYESRAMTTDQWERLIIRSVEEEEDPHVVFHNLQAVLYGLQKAGKSAGLDQVIETSLERFRAGQARCTHQLIVMYADFVGRTGGWLAEGTEVGYEEFPEVVEGLLYPALHEVHGFAACGKPEARYTDNVATWERIEIVLFMIGDIGVRSGVLSPDRVHGWFARALECPFWIIQWWTISNMSRYPAERTYETLFEGGGGGAFGGLMNDELLDLRLLCARHLLRVAEEALAVGHPEVFDAIEQRLPEVTQELQTRHADIDRRTLEEVRLLDRALSELRRKEG